METRNRESLLRKKIAQKLIHAVHIMEVTECAHVRGWEEDKVFFPGLNALKICMFL